MSEPITVAFIGCGEAAKMHSGTLKKLGGVRRVYASRSAERARALADEQDGDGWFDGYDAALADPGVDVALVLTPPAHHLENTLAALAAGKDVIVEKPPFLSVADLDRAGEAAAAAGRRLFVAENYFYKPVLRRLRGILDAGEIGEPRQLYVNAMKHQAGDGWRGDPETAGGGALFEGGIHWVDFMANLGLDVVDVHGRRTGAAEGPEREMVLLFDYRGGAAGTLFFSWNAPSPLKGLRVSRIYGSHGSIAFESNGLWIAVWGERKRFVLPGLRDISGYRAMFGDFLDALRTGRPARYTPDHARRDLELVARAYATAEKASRRPA
jgi:predicted dehydrogenase